MHIIGWHLQRVHDKKSGMCQRDWWHAEAVAYDTVSQHRQNGSSLVSCITSSGYCNKHQPLLTVHDILCKLYIQQVAVHDILCKLYVQQVAVRDILCKFYVQQAAVHDNLGKLYVQQVAVHDILGKFYVQQVVVITF